MLGFRDGYGGSAGPIAMIQNLLPICEGSRPVALKSIQCRLVGLGYESGLEA